MEIVRHVKNISELILLEDLVFKVLVLMLNTLMRRVTVKIVTHVQDQV
jgi:hypothetical protein